MLERIDITLRFLLSRMVRVYQLFISPHFLPSCRFAPSCSNYALEVLQTWPLLSGLWLIAKRLGRCQPFCHGGFDPVPRYPGRSSRHTSSTG